MRGLVKATETSPSVVQTAVTMVIQGRVGLDVSRVRSVCWESAYDCVVCPLFLQLALQVVRSLAWLDTLSIGS